MTSREQLDFKGKVVLVTGSTKGIGAALARGFAGHGASVWVHGRDEQAGQKLAAEIRGTFVKADLAQKQEVEQLAERIKAAESQLDVLVNNAGLEIPMSLEKMDMANFDLLWHVNVRAPVQLTHLLLPLLRKAAAASIINVTSIHDSVAYPVNAAYTMSKAALAMFTKTIAVELAPEGIRVNNLAPGAVETEINRDVLDAIGREQFRQWIPLGRTAVPDEIVGPALFLASANASYITGSTLYADGGYLHNLLRYRLTDSPHQ